MIEIIEDVAEGTGLRAAIASRGATIRSFFSVLHTMPDLEAAYDLARKARAEVLVDEVILIADNLELNPIRARNQIDARKWYAAKMQPTKYGDRLDINVNQTVDISGALNDAKARVTRRISDARQVIEAQAIETTDADARNTTDLASVSDTPQENEEDIFS